MSLTPLQLAEVIARKAHEGQRDLSNQDYALHLQRVSEACATDDAKAVAWLHDAIEDGHVIEHDLLSAGIPDRIVYAVRLLTKGKDEPYVQYLERICRAENGLAITVKLADLRDNLREGCPPRLANRYRSALEMLERYVIDRIERCEVTR